MRARLAGGLRAIARRLESNRPELNDLPALEVVEGVMADQLQGQQQRSSALDQRAGVLVGFAGVLVGVLAQDLQWYAVPAVVLGAASAGVGIWALWPRTGIEIDPQEFAEKYVAVVPQEARFVALSTRALVYENDEAALARKGRRFRGSALLLGGAIAAFLLGSTLNLIQGGEDGWNHHPGRCHERLEPHVDHPCPRR